MTQSGVFRRKPRVTSFLEYTVRQTLDNQHSRLKEYSIAVEVFERPVDFDPRLDSIVRVEARRLRATVEHYYSTEGREDELIIRYRRGNYIPEFLRRDEIDGGSDVGGAVHFGGVLLGVLNQDVNLVDSAGALTSASLTILRAPFQPEVLALLRSQDRRIVLLKPATSEDIERILSSGDSR